MKTIIRLHSLFQVKLQFRRTKPDETPRLRKMIQKCKLLKIVYVLLLEIYPLCSPWLPWLHGHRWKPSNWFFVPIGTGNPSQVTSSKHLLRLYLGGGFWAPTTFSESIWSRLPSESIRHCRPRRPRSEVQLSTCQDRYCEWVELELLPDMTCNLYSVTAGHQLLPGKPQCQTLARTMVEECWRIGMGLLGHTWAIVV